MCGFDKPYEIHLPNVYQTTVLMLFNDVLKIGIGEIEALTGMTTEDTWKAVKPFIDIKLFIYDETVQTIELNLRFKR